jgi:hypothetical protein
VVIFNLIADISYTLLDPRVARWVRGGFTVDGVTNRTPSPRKDFFMFNLLMS